MPYFFDNRDAPPYTDALMGFLHDFGKSHPVNEPTLWLNLFRVFLRSHGGIERLLRGEFAEYITEIDRDVINWIIELYDYAIVESRYPNLWDVMKFGIDETLPICPHTKQRVKPISVSERTLTALERVWDMYYGKSHDIEREPGVIGRYMPLFQYMMAHLLNISLHCEWAGVSFPAGFKSFEEKWQAVRDWPDSGIMGGMVMLVFLCEININDKLSLLNMRYYLPEDMKRKLYLDTLDQFQNRRDRKYFGDCDPTKPHLFRKIPHYVLAKQVFEEDKDLFDESFRDIFRPYYEAVPRQDQKDS
jgi:hypothetical protein